ncbi:hypothetical protein BRC19_01550 [Candidatus Saccharibacteria bacterium QS_5_54_17]|nr:MAG: hypothetical protein BRC19_01550 [Candidatus Saccharibacteria bacterium QS_5_54_17]
MADKQSPDVPWYSEEAGFFGENYIKEYGEKLTEERTQQEIDFLENVLTLEQGDTVFDCPCGQGRHSIELARRGYDVTGQDLNSYLINEAKKNSEEAGVSVDWRQGDMREVPFEEEFEAAINLFTSFGYLESDDEDQKVLDQTAKALKPGGQFVLDIINRDRVLCNWIGKTWEDCHDGSVILKERELEHLTGRSHERRTTIYSNGEREVLNIQHRHYTVTELVAMLNKAGFSVKGLYGSYNADSYTTASNRCIIVAGKA